MKKIVTLVVSILLLTNFLMTHTAYSPGAVPTGMPVGVGAGPAGQTFGIPGGPQFQTYEEFMEWQEAANKEIDQFVKTLSADEQQQFFKDVEELTKVMSEMDPNDLEQWLKNVLPQDQMPMAPEPIPGPTPEAPIAQPEKVQEPVISTKAADSLTKIIEEIIRHTERFLRTSQMIPELPGRIESWVSKNQLKEWHADVTWETLKARIEELNQKLHQLLDVDPKTKKPKYLGYLAEQESLKNNLSHLLETLKQYEPKVEAPSFGLGKVTKESRQAIKEVLASLTEAVYKLGLIADLTKVIEHYEPRAKELRETEESHQKKALEESKRTRSGASKVEIGTPDYGMGGGYGGGDYAPEFSYATPAPVYDFSYPSTGQDYYGSENYPYGAADETRGKPGTKKEPAGGGSTRAKGEKGEGDKTPSKAPEAAKEDPATKRSINKIEKNLDDFASTVEKSKLVNIQTHATDNSPVDQDFAAYQLPNALRKLKNVVDQIKTLKVSLKKLNPATEKAALDEVRAIATAHKDLLDTLNNQIFAVKTNANVPADKATAYKALLEDLATTIGSFVAATGLSSSPPSGQRSRRGAVAPTAPSMPSYAAPTGIPAELEQPEQATAPQPTRTVPGAAPRVELPAGVERLLNRIDNDLEKAERIINDNNELRTVELHTKNAVTPALPAVTLAIRLSLSELKAVQRTIDALKKIIATLSPEQKKAAKERLQSYVLEHPTLDELTKQIEALRSVTPATAIQAGKRYAYLGATDADFTTAADRKIVADIKATITEPASLYELFDAIQGIKKSVHSVA